MIKEASSINNKTPAGWEDSASSFRLDPPLGVTKPKLRLSRSEKRKKERKEKSRHTSKKKELKKSKSKICLQ